MTMFGTKKLTADEHAWLSLVAMLQQNNPSAHHRCARCTTPYGRSTIKCPNDR